MTNTDNSWLSDLKVYLQPRVLTIFLLGLASGFPWVMIGSALAAWLQEQGLSRSDIGFFSAVSVVYSVNFIWSPLIDSLKLPLLAKRFGLRRSWILVCQITIAAACFIMAQLTISEHLYWIGGLALAIAISSATQDIAIDAYRIESFAENEGRLQSAGAAMTTAGWWTGYAGMGAIPFLLVDNTQWFWQDAYQVLGSCMLVIAILVLLAKRAAFHKDTQEQQVVKASSLKERLETVVVAPFREFFQRNGVKFALSVLLFIFLFKIGEAFLGKMSIVFYKEVGFSNAQIGTYSKLITWWVTIVFALLGSLVNLRTGIIKGLFFGGIAMAGSNLLFSWIALVGPSEPLFLGAVLVDGFTSAWSTVAFVAFVSLLCNRTFTASQYALMASLGTLGRNALGAYSGVLADSLGGNWSIFFLLTALMVIPSLLFLWFIRKPIQRLEAERDG